MLENYRQKILEIQEWFSFKQALTHCQSVNTDSLKHYDRVKNAIHQLGKQGKIEVYETGTRRTQGQLYRVKDHA